MQIFILGMHRSGTSLLAQLLNMMGAYFSAEGMSTLANEENLKGFWERPDIRQSNDKLLSSKGYDWNRIHSFSLDLLPEEAKSTYKEEISRILLEMDTHRPWVIKEPRLCLLLPLWKPLLEVPICVFIYRNPVEVAFSLKKRNDIPLHTGVALWEKYNILALEAGADIPMIFVSFSEILENPISATLKIYNSLKSHGVKGIKLPSDEEVSSFISTNLYRSRSNNFKENEFLNEKQIELFSLLKNNSNLNNTFTSKVSEGCNILLGEYEILIKQLEEINTIRDISIEKLDKCKNDAADKKIIYEDKLKDLRKYHEDQSRNLKILHQEELNKQKHLQDEQLTIQKDIYINEIEGMKSQHANLESLITKWKDKSEGLSTELNNAHHALNTIAAELTAFKQRKVVKAIEKVAPLGRLLKRLLRHPRQTLAPFIKRNLSVLREVRSRKQYSRITANIKKLRPDIKITDGPLVSIVILTRNGAHHMKRLLAALEDNTSYRNFEVIVVDNDSTDNTEEILSIKRNFKLHVIRNNFNASFSKANNQAVEIAQGTLLLFLNNDIEPINKSWLGALVESIDDRQRVAAGALLIYPYRTSTLDDKKNIDLTVQHKCIRFEWRHKVPHPVNISGDQQPDHPSLAQVKTVPAVTAACMMVKAEQFNLINGFSEKYVYGAEDVDLCMKLTQQGGKIVYVGQAALFHYESATQDTLLTNNIKRINRTGNWQLFIEQWGPLLSRTLRREMLNVTQPFWRNSKTRTMAITAHGGNNPSSADNCRFGYEIGSAFKNKGWEVIYLDEVYNNWSKPPQGIDVIISFQSNYNPSPAPSHTIKVAWLGNNTGHWLKQKVLKYYDQVIVSTANDADLLQQETGKRPAIIPVGSNLGIFKAGEPDPTYKCDYAYIGNFLPHTRNLFTFLTVLENEKFFIFGNDWEKAPWLNRYWRWHLPHQEYSKLYVSSKIIIDDNTSRSFPAAMVSAQVFNALAAGALVVTNDHVVSKECFNGMLPTYDSSKQLRELLTTYLRDDRLRNELVTKLRRRVAENFDIEFACNNVETLLKQEVERLKIILKTCVPKREDTAIWGDTHFAECFGHALGNEGFRTDIQIMPEWDLPMSQDGDIVVHLRGVNAYVPKPGAFNILWIISHPEDISLEECQAYDLILVASDIFAEKLKQRVNVPVYPFLQATDEKRFTPLQPDDRQKSDLLFVGNTRNQVRPCINWASELDRELHVYGSGWDQTEIPSKDIKGEYYPNDQLNVVYSSTKILLNDHWSDMKKYGFISNRIFDALACRTFIISDEVPGIQEVFRGAVPTFKDKNDFNSKINYYIDHDSKREELISIGQDIVLSEHTFKVRAQQLKVLINKHFNPSK